MQNYFSLFQLPLGFVLDRDQLDIAYREVQSTVHPDKFAQASDAEKRVAMQWATHANAAYQTLKDPLKRATYLCKLNDVDLQVESNTSMPAAFLMQQMEWRESFEAARHQQNRSALLDLENDVQKAYKLLIEQVGIAIDANDFQTAAKQIRSCLFLEKFLEDIAALDES